MSLRTACTPLISAVAFGIIAVSAVSADPAAAGHAWLVERVTDFNTARHRLTAEDLARLIVDDAVDVEAFGDRVLGDYVEDSLSELREHLRRDEYLFYLAVMRQRVLAALQDRIVADLTAQLAGGAPDSLKVASAKLDDDDGKVVLHTADGDFPALTCYLHRQEDGPWHLVDLAIGDERLSRTLHKRYGDTLDQRYSPSVLISQLRDLDYVSLEDFSASTPGQLPVGWYWLDRDEDKRKPYRVGERDGRYYLAAADSGGSVMLGRLARWNPRHYPIMTWCWRADALPPGGDERFGHSNDSAAGIYVVFHFNWIGLPRHIKYVWSTTLPEGTVGRRNRIARPYFVVVDSGDEDTGNWRFATVDLEADYDQTYGGRPKDKTQAIGLLSDANSTDSRAEAYYADLRVWSRAAWESGRVEDHCGPYRALDLPFDTDTDTAVGGTAASQPGTQP